MTKIESNQKNILTITTGDKVSEFSIIPNNTGIIATSNGSLIRVLNDAQRLEFAPITLIGGKKIKGKSQESDEIILESDQDWVLVASHADKIIY